MTFESPEFRKQLMIKKFRVAVVGGGMGRHHIMAFQKLPEQFEVRAICDIDEKRTRELAETFNIPYAVTNITELYRRDDIDLIDICTPSYLHYEQTLESLAAGKYVICEKPVAGSLKQLDEFITAEAQAGKRIMPIFQYRFGGGLQKLKWLRDQGVTGKALLTTVETAWRRRPDYYEALWRGKWQTELGGALLTLAVHAHDAVYYILGSAKSVAAHIATLVNTIETEDSASISLQMADGSLCSLSVTTGSAIQISRHRFCFSNLTAESNLEPYANTSGEWKFTADSPEAEERIAQTLEIFKPQPEGLVGQFSRYYHAMQTNSPLPVTLADARASLELITAIYHSARTRQTVQLPIGNDHPLYAGWQP
jgi:predicted dehydrogenase